MFRSAGGRNRSEPGCFTSRLLWPLADYENGDRTLAANGRRRSRLTAADAHSPRWQPQFGQQQRTERPGRSPICPNTAAGPEKMQEAGVCTNVTGDQVDFGTTAIVSTSGSLSVTSGTVNGLGTSPVGDRHCPGQALPNDLSLAENTR